MTPEEHVAATMLEGLEKELPVDEMVRALAAITKALVLELPVTNDEEKRVAREELIAATDEMLQRPRP